MRTLGLRAVEVTTRVGKTTLRVLWVHDTWMKGDKTLHRKEGYANRSIVELTEYLPSSSVSIMAQRL